MNNININNYKEEFLKLNDKEKLEVFNSLLNRKLNSESLNFYTDFFDGLTDEDQLYYIKSMLDNSDFDFKWDYYFNDYYDLDTDHIVKLTTK